MFCGLFLSLYNEVLTTYNVFVLFVTYHFLNGLFINHLITEIYINLWYIFCIFRGFLLRVSTEECRSFLGRVNYCCPENEEGDDIQNSAVAMNTEYNRRPSNISNIRPTEIEMVGPDSANEKTKLFDGENNLKVNSKPPHQPPNNASSTSSSHQPDNIANGDNNSGT